MAIAKCGIKQEHYLITGEINEQTDQVCMSIMAISRQAKSRYMEKSVVAAYDQFEGIGDEKSYPDALEMSNLHLLPMVGRRMLRGCSQTENKLLLCIAVPRACKGCMKIAGGWGSSANETPIEHQNTFSLPASIRIVRRTRELVSIHGWTVCDSSRGLLMDNLDLQPRSTCEVRLSSLEGCLSGIPNMDPCTSGYSPSSNAGYRRMSVRSFEAITNTVMV